MSKSLFEISENLIGLFHDIEEAGGEITPEQEEVLAISESDLEQKMRGYRYFIEETKATSVMLKDEAKRLTARAKSRENLVDRLKESICTALILFGDDNGKGGKRLKYSDLTIFTKDNKSVVWDEDTYTKFLHEYSMYSSLDSKYNITEILDRFIDVSITITCKPSETRHIVNRLDEYGIVALHDSNEDSLSFYEIDFKTNKANAKHFIETVYHCNTGVKGDLIDTHWLHNANELLDKSSLSLTKKTHAEFR